MNKYEKTRKIRKNTKYSLACDSDAVCSSSVFAIAALSNVEERRVHFLDLGNSCFCMHHVLMCCRELFVSGTK